MSSRWTRLGGICVLAFTFMIAGAAALVETKHGAPKPADEQGSQLRLQPQPQAEDDQFAELVCCSAGGICAVYGSCPSGTRMVQCPCDIIWADDPSGS